MTSATIVLLPFDNLSGDPEQDRLARGVLQDVATELSRFSTLEVVHPESTALVLDSRRAPAAPREAPTFLLKGSVRRAAETVRVAVQLLEAATGRQVWADRYSPSAPELLDVQDQIASGVAGALALSVDGARLALASRQPLASLEAYDCWLRGRECLQRGTVESDADARVFFERALEIDPRFARALAGLSLSHFNEWSCQAWEQWDEKERLAYTYARQAAALDDSDAVIAVVLGRILLYRREFDEGAHQVQRAVGLNPNDSDVLAQAALCQAYLGEAPSAVALARKAIRLHPRFPEWYLAAAGLSLFVAGDYAESVEAGARAPGVTVDASAFLAACCALMDDAARAGWYLERFLAQFTERVTFGREPEPGEPLRWLLHVNPFRRREDAERLAAGLTAAGLARDPDESQPRARPVAAPSPVPPTFRRTSAFWALAFDGLTVHLSDVKGFADIALLLGRPHQEVHCLELAGRPREDAPADEMLDARARRDIGARVRELQREIEDADAAHDQARGEQARVELDRIVDLLAGSLGLHGRSRRLGSAAERARSAVTWRIRSAVKKIASSHPRLGRHLENSLRTGVFCSYTPESPVDWEL